MRRARLSVLAAVALAGSALAEPARYTWAGAEGEALAARFPPPGGATRVALAPESFGAWLRQLPLQPAGARVHYFDGRDKPRQDVHAAVVAIDVGKRDLQQCADAVMRLYAEWRYARGEPVVFHPEPGKATTLGFHGGTRAAFAKYLVRLFADAGTASLAAELRRVPALAPLQPGDVLIQGGYPGHAVLVVDAAEDAAGHRYVMLAQSYMPAQEIHVLKNLEAPALSPWYDAAALDAAGVRTPEWRPFTRADARRF